VGESAKLKSIKFFLVVVLGLVLVVGIGYWVYQLLQAESITVLECMIGEKAPQKFYVKMKSTGGKPAEITRIAVWSMNYTFLENIVVPGGTTIAILIPDTYAGGKTTVKTLDGEPATGDGTMVVLEGAWPEEVWGGFGPDQPYDPSTYYSVTIYGVEGKRLWTSISVNVAPELPDP